MEKAAFKLDEFKFVKASLNFDIPDDVILNIEFNPSGVYMQSLGVYNLEFGVKVTCKETEVVDVLCKARFSFEKPVPKEDIPNFFYPNSLAILFPYVRAFVSTITLQANVHPVVLPTVNLMGLTSELIDKTKIE